MTIWWLAVVLGGLAALCGGFVWMTLTLGKRQPKDVAPQPSPNELGKAYSDIAEEDASHLFNKEFREELRNRGRLRFEKIIDENAEFLKQDLNATTSRLNEYMEKQVATRLDTEFANYAQAMKQAQQLALGTLQKTAQDIEVQRVALADALQKEVTEREAVLLKGYEENMAKIVEHYVLAALGDQFDLKDQLPYIIKQMEANKAAIMEDMRL